MDYDALAAVAAANARLKAAGVRCSIELRGTRLNLRASLRDPQGRSRQQRIALGVPPTRAGVEEAMRCARNLAVPPAPSRGAPTPEVVTGAKLRAALRELVEARYGEAWNLRDWGDPRWIAWATHWRPLEASIPDGVQDVEALRALVHLYPQNSARRRDQGQRLARVAAACGLDPAPIRQAARGYGSRRLTPRTVPSDAEILQSLEKLVLPHWRWVYGLVAAYGIRSHEAATAALDSTGELVIDEDTKTKGRIVYPCPANWVEQLDLLNVCRPRVKPRRLSHTISLYIRSKGVSIMLYDLRHAYALRLLSRGVSISVAAKLMGHSVVVHEKTYQRWINADHVRQSVKNYNLA